MGARGRCTFWSSTFPFLASTANTGCSSCLRSPPALFSSPAAPAAGIDSRSFHSCAGSLILSDAARNLAMDHPFSGIRHEICDCCGHRAGLCNIGRRRCQCTKRAARSVAALHGARRLFRRIAVCADRYLARQGDARDHAAKRTSLLHDVAGPAAVARSSAAARPGVSPVVRSGQSGPLAVGFRRGRQIRFLIETIL